MLLTKIAVVTASLTLLVLAAGWAGADGDDPKAGAAADKGREAVEAWLKRLTKGESLPAPPKIEAVNGAVSDFFPDDRFFAVRFMRYPRAVKPPPPLRLENLVRVRPDGSVDRVESPNALTKLFEAKLANVADEAGARAALRAALRLAEEFYQDGLYTFAVPEQSVSVAHQDDHLVASGRAVVTGGGKGEITVTLTTGARGTVAVAGQVRPDVRNR
jgi:hypothetical protein